MNYEKYIESTRRTFNYQDPKTDLKHVLLGIVDEIGEIAGAVKKKVGYGQNINVTNIKEELGDLSYFVAQLIDQMKFSGPLQEGILKDIKGIMSGKINKEAKIDMFDHTRHLAGYGFNIMISIEHKDDNIDVEGIIHNCLFIIQVMNRIAYDCGTSYSKILDANIAKLKKRFPEKFDAELAKEENRDRGKEEKEIISNTENKS